MRPKISLLGLFIAYFFLLSCGGGGGGGGGNDSVRDTQINAQSNFIQVKDENYTLKQITETEISIPGQHALLPNGNIVFADVNFNRISIIIDETVKVIADEDNIDGWNVCTLPDGRICYSLLDGQLILIDPNSKIKQYFSSIPNGARVSALAADEFGNIFAATSHFELYRFRTRWRSYQTRG